MKCIFHQGHTDHNGNRKIPPLCKEAILEKHKKIVEKCEITKAEDCPLGKYRAVKDEEKVSGGKLVRDDGEGWR